MGRAVQVVALNTAPLELVHNVLRTGPAHQLSRPGRPLPLLRRPWTGLVRSGYGYADIDPALVHDHLSHLEDAKAFVEAVSAYLKAEGAPVIGRAASLG